MSRSQHEKKAPTPHWWTSCGIKYYLHDTESDSPRWIEIHGQCPVEGVNHSSRYPVNIGGAWEIEGFHFRNKFIKLFYRPGLDR